MRRFFVPAETLGGEQIPLSTEILHHLGVLRISVDEKILLLDGAGGFCRCRIESLSKKAGTARVLDRWREEETAFPIHLLQGLPKGDKMDLVLQKGTELGITAFTPTLTERSVHRLPAAREEKRRQRWLRILAEAARQCRRPLLPRLAPPLPLSEALASCGEELRLMLWEEESRPMADLLPPAPPQSAAVLVGPEGGFTAAEAEQARAAGFIPVRIGPRILRSETAGFAVAAILQYTYGDLRSSPPDAPPIGSPPGDCR